MTLPTGRDADFAPRDAGDAARERRLSRLALSLDRAGRRALAATLAHELSQPVSVILSYATALAPRVRSIPAAEVERTFDTIARQAQRTKESLQSLKRAIRRQDSSEDSADPNEIVRDVARLFEGTLRDDRISLRLELSAGVPIPGADPGTIGAVIAELLRNACEAFPKDHRGPREIEVSTSQPAGAAIEVAIRDTGEGVPPELATRIFDRYFTTRPGGLGMGLPVSRSIVEGLGGRLWLDTKPDTGATFRFTLPPPEGGSAYAF